MNCIEFRRKLLEDPARTDADFAAHRATCAACDAEAREAERLDTALRDLVRVDPPADLEQRLYRRPSSRRRIPLALAASLAGLVAVSVVFWHQWGPAAADRRLAAEVMDHVLHEPQAFVAHEPLSIDRLRATSASVSLDPEGFQHAVVTYAMPCELMSRPGLHLVIASDRGPVTLLVIVDVEIAEPRLVSREGFRGVVTPIRDGSVAVIGAPDAPVEQLAQDLTPYLHVRG
jgi:hypothetical protein